MRSIGSVGLLLILFGAGIYAKDPDESVTVNTTGVPFTTSETVKESTVSTIIESTTAPSTTVGTTSEPVLYCENLKSNMEISKIITCQGDDIKMDTMVLNLSRFTDDDVKQLSFVDGTIRFLQCSLIVVKSEITKLELNFKPDRDVDTVYRITDNSYLKNVTVPDARLKGKKDPVAIIRGNKKLGNESLQHLRTIFANMKAPESYIQDVGECRMTSTYLEEYSYLEECGYFDGPLEINEQTNGPLPETLSFNELRGCFSIKKVDSITSLDFLSNLKPNCSSTNEISGNENLCLTSEKKAYWMERLDPVIIEQNSNCPDVCTPSWAEKNRNNASIKCTKIVGNLKIQGKKDEKDFEYLLNTEEIDGQIEIIGNSFSNFSFLANLKRINSSSKGPGLYVTNNNNMTIFNISSMESIDNAVDTGPQILFNNNGEFQFEPHEAEQIYKIAGKANIPHIRKNKTIFIRPEVNNTDESQHENNETKGASKISGKKEEESNDLEMGLGIGIGLLILLALIAGVILIVVCVIRLRKRRIKKQLEKKARKKIEDEIDEESDNNEEEGIKKITFHSYGCPMPAKPENERIVTNYMQINMKKTSDPTVDFMKLTDDEILYFKAKQNNWEVRRNTGTWSRADNCLSMTYGCIAINNDIQVEKNLKEYTPTYVNEIDFNNYYTIPEEEASLKPIVYKKKSKVESILKFLNENLRPVANVYSYNVVRQVMDHLSNEIKETTRTNQLVKIEGPVQFVGDIKGSIYDLASILSHRPGKSSSLFSYKYVFCGNYLGGANSDLQCLLVLLLLAKENKNVILLRGINEYGEAAQKLLQKATEHNFPKLGKKTRDKLINEFLEIFNKMPMGALVNGKILAVHGGISKRLYGSDGILNIDSVFDQIPMPLPPNPTPAVSRLVEDILFSEPCPVSHPMTANGVGCYFNDKMLHNFRKQMNLDLVVTGRSNTGYLILMNGRLITLSGNYDKLLTKHGIYKALRKRNVLEHLFEENRILNDFGVLRVNDNGSLTMNTIRHVYDKKRIMKTMQNMVINDEDKIQEGCLAKKEKYLQLIKRGENFEKEEEDLKKELERKEEESKKLEEEEVPKMLATHKQMSENKDYLKIHHPHHVMKRPEIPHSDVKLLNDTAYFSDWDENFLMKLYVLRKLCKVKKFEEREKTLMHVYPEWYGLTKTTIGQIFDYWKQVEDDFERCNIDVNASWYLKGIQFKYAYVMGKCVSNINPKQESGYLSKHVLDFTGFLKGYKQE